MNENKTDLNGTKILEYDQANGLHVILQEDHFAPVTAFQMWVNVGSADETPEEAGMAHVLEHMLFKGTENRAVGEIARDIESAGGDVNAWTSHDETVFHLVLPSKEFTSGLDILSDAIKNSALDASELKNELEVIIEELKRGKDSPGHNLSEETFSTTFKTHPYGLPVIGTEESVRSFDREKVLAFYRKWYVPSNMTLVLVGDFDTDKAVLQIEKFFSNYKSTKQVTADIQKEPEQTSSRSSTLSDDVQQTHLSISFPSESILGENTPALDIIGVILGQGDSSRLIRNLQRKRTLINDAFAYPYAGKTAGLFLLNAILPTENLEETIPLLAKELFRLRYENITQKELEKAKTILENEAVYQRQTMQGKSRMLGNSHLMTGDSHFLFKYLEKTARLTAFDVKQAARKLFALDKFSIVQLAPASEKHPNKSKLIELVKQGYDLAKAEFDKQAKHANNEIREHILKNGLRLLIKENHSVPLVSVQAGFLGGLRFENEENNGINNLIARMLTLGTSTMKAEEIAQTIDSMAGGLSGFSGRNTLGLKAMSISRNFEKTFDLFKSCLLDPVFDADELKKEKMLIAQEINAKKDQPSRMAFEIFHKTLYQTHPFKMDALGSLKSLKGLTSSKLAEYYKQIFEPSSVSISIVGDIETDQVIKLVENSFADLKPFKRPFKDPKTEKPLETIKINKVALDKEQTQIIMGFCGLRFSDEERFSLEVLNAVLSGQGGRLFTELRDKQSLAYSVGSFHLESLDPGYFALYIGTSPEKREAAIKAMHEQLELVLENDITEEEIALAKRYLVGSHSIGLQTNASQAGQMLLNDLYDIGYDAHLDFGKQINAVNKASVEAIAKQIINLDAYVLIELGQEEDQD